LGIYISSIHII